MDMCLHTNLAYGVSQLKKYLCECLRNIESSLQDQPSLATLNLVQNECILAAYSQWCIFIS